jgi:hypothetical protein
VSRLIRTLRDYGVGTGILLGETERLDISGKENDTGVRIYLTDSIDEFLAVHTGHPVIRYDNIELFDLEEFQAFFAMTGDLDPVSQFLEQRFADEETVPAIVYEEDVRRNRQRSLHQERMRD